MKKEKKYGLIDVTRVFKSEYNHTNTVTAELRQVVETTTYYPKTKIQNSLQDNIFAETEFEKYRIIQDQLYMSDFDRYLLELEEKMK